ncbi:MAG: IPT/TIG domain-containing protein, partial [Anaerolineae bacterium]|nr:IPT/TIG domain-containing protein [Anaerolineae bacterium]
QGGYVHFRYKVPGHQWTAPVILTTWSGIGAPQIHSDAEGHLNLAFEQSPGTPVMGRNLPRGVKLSALSQVITIPEDMHKPTLSFDYTLTGALQATEGLSATLVGEGFAFSLPVSDETTDWQRIWADVSPWAGETVTLTLAASVRELQSNLQVSLDDISLGSWLTPLPTAVTPIKLTPYASVVITVTGSNFLEGAQVVIDDLLLDSTWVSATEITATMPATLALGGHLLRVVNPGGQTGYAPQVLVVGEAVYIPVLLKSSPWVQ